MTQTFYRTPELSNVQHKVTRESRAAARPLTGGCPKLSNSEVTALVLAMMKGRRLYLVAKDTGISETTLHNWLNGYNRKAAYFEAKHQYEQWLREHSDAPG